MNYLTKQQIFGMYLGKVDVTFPDEDSPDLLTGIVENSIFVSGGCDYCIDDCKLILRSWKELTKLEENKSQDVYNTGTTQDYFAYLIYIGIDVFDCHAEGWCIYESELQKGETKC